MNKAWKLRFREVKWFVQYHPARKVNREVQKLGERIRHLGFSLSFFFFFGFLGLHLQQMEVPRLGGESELQLPAYTTATATQDLSHICDLHHSSWQCQIPNPLNEARDQTCILMNTSQIHFCCSAMVTSWLLILTIPFTFFFPLFWSGTSWSPQISIFFSKNVTIIPN